MKLVKFFVSIAILLSYGPWFNKCYAHLEHVHQYLVKQAYYFLENELQCEIFGVKNAVGLNYDGPALVPVKSSNDPYYTKYGIGIGSWLEDVDDPVWGLGDPITDYITPSVSHFWDSDYGNDQQTHMNVWGIPINAPNAWTKARAYYNGNYDLFIPKVQIGFNEHGNPVLMAGRYYSYNSLIDLYNTGRAYYKGYMSIDGQKHIVANNLGYSSVPLINKI